MSEGTVIAYGKSRILRVVRYGGEREHGAAYHVEQEQDFRDPKGNPDVTVKHWKVFARANGPDARWEAFDVIREVQERWAEIDRYR